MSGQCACGNLDQPCCFNGRPTTLGPCASLELSCDNIGSAASGLCKPCGKKDTPCCLGDTCIEMGTGCLSDGGLSQKTCRPCGGSGQPCCPSPSSVGTCRDPGTSCNATTLRCVAVP
jgi:hypothetical protein